MLLITGKYRPQDDLDTIKMLYYDMFYALLFIKIVENVPTTKVGVLWE